MKIGKGVEWAAHTCALLALLPAGAALSGEVLAEFIGVPSPYLAKQLQSLSRAGFVTLLAHAGAKSAGSNLSTSAALEAHLMRVEIGPSCANWPQEHHWPNFTLQAEAGTPYKGPKNLRLNI